MKFPRSARRMLTLLASASLLLTAPVHAAAHANSSDSAEPTGPPSNSVWHSGDGDEVTTGEPEMQALSSSGVILPGCYGTLDNVHPSGGMASVHGRTVCPAAERNYISLSIGYIGWFGERYAVTYNDKGTINGATAYGQVKSVCSGKGLQTWRAFGFHSIRLGGNAFYTDTTRDGRFSC